MALEHPVNEHTVELPLGRVVVTLERAGLELSQRGGFEARWADPDEGEALTPEAYRKIVKAHLAEVYEREVGREPFNIPLNLASHQLMDDLEGWTKLNYAP